MTHVLLDIADGIGTVTLNRPERLNALNRASWPAWSSGVSSTKARNFSISSCLGEYDSPITPTLI